MRAGWGVAGIVAVALALVVSCGAPVPQPTTVPTFPVPAAGARESGAAATEDGAVPDDCARILGAADLGALLGLPLDSVSVRTTLHVAQPSVGRTERVACHYTGAAGGPPGGTLLDLDVSAYTDVDAAAKQWRVNADAEDGAHRELPIGAASGVLVERAGEALLLVAHGSYNITVVLPDRPLPGGRPRGEVLVDLALRVLPAVAPPPPTTASPPPTAAGPAQAAGTQL